MNALQDNRTKPGRALPRVWRRFAFLRSGERFDFKGRTFCASEFFTFFGMAKVARVDLDMERTAWLFPWTKVRTHTLVRDKALADLGDPFSETRAAIRHEIGKVYQAPLPPNNDDGRTGPSA